MKGNLIGKFFEGGVDFENFSGSSRGYNYKTFVLQILFKFLHKILIYKQHNLIDLDFEFSHLE